MFDCFIFPGPAEQGRRVWGPEVGCLVVVECVL